MESFGSGAHLTLYRLLLPGRRRQLFVLGLLMPLTAIAEMAMVAAVVPFIGALDNRQSESLFSRLLEVAGRFMATNELAAAALLFVIATVMASALRLALSWLTLRFSADLGHELNMGVQQRLLHQPYLFHSSSHSSRFLSSLDKVDELVLSYGQRGLQLISSLIIATAVTAALFLIDAPSAAAATLLVATLYGAALLVVRRNYRDHSEVLASTHYQRIQVVQENLGGIRDIILDKSQDAHLAQFGAVDEPFMKTRSAVSFLANAPRHLVEGAGLILVALAALFVADRPGGLTMALPVLGALALAALRLLPLAGQIYSSWVIMASARPVVREILSLLSLPIQLDKEQTAGMAFMKSITLEGVGLRYPGRPQPALHEISLSIAKGERIAIVGRTGSGKSTLADLLMGLIEPSEGQIRVDGTLLAGAMLGAWRRSVAHVPQAIFLADASIARNIALSVPDGPLDMTRIERAAETAQLHNFVATLPDGYDTCVGERGVKLSGGQRQRLVLARAIYKRAPFLVLDEATSALDEDTEEAIFSSLDGLHDEGCTIVIIAHRLSTVERCDRIFMLEDGQLAQSGSFSELFGRLNRLQERGELCG